MTKLASVDDVVIDPSGTFKYILIQVNDPSSNSSKLIVRGATSCAYHADIFDQTRSVENRDLKLKCLGGGRIKHEPTNKSLFVYGYSQMSLLYLQPGCSRFISRIPPTVTFARNARVFIRMSKRSSPNNRSTIEPNANILKETMPKTEKAEKAKYLKHLDVIAVNILTLKRSLARLSQIPGMRRYRKTKLSSLPSEAIIGLKRVLIDLKRSPKDLQVAADRLTNILASRLYPPSFEEVNKFKREYAAKMKEDSYGFDITSGVFGKKLKRAWETELESRTAEHFQKRHNTYKPIRVRSREEAAIFALSHGIGSVFWACHSKWGNAIKDFCFVEPNDLLSQFAMDIMRGDEEDERGLITNRVHFRRTLPINSVKTYDVTFLHRTLIELSTEKERMVILESLWQKTNKYMVIIESHLRDSFESVIAARDYILGKGYTVNPDNTIQLFKENNRMGKQVAKVLMDYGISAKEKYLILKTMLPANVNLPTNLDHGFVFAPCPHDVGCPRLLSTNHRATCSFSAKAKEIRVGGKSTNGDDTIKSRYSYVILEKGERPRVPPCSRIIGGSKAKSACTVITCTPFDGLQQYQVSKKGLNFYKILKNSRPGEVLSLKDEYLVSPDSELGPIKEQLLLGPKKTE